jgi:transposase InsO family protein
VRVHLADFKIATMCRVLGVSSGGYYAWLTREPSQREIWDPAPLERIVAIHETSRGTYGMPSIHAGLRAEGVQVGRKRVARLMRQKGLEGVSRRRKGRTTIRNADTAAAPDLVGRDFSAS